MARDRRTSVPKRRARWVARDASGWAGPSGRWPRPRRPGWITRPPGGAPRSRKVLVAAAQSPPTQHPDRHRRPCPPGHLAVGLSACRRSRHHPAVRGAHRVAARQARRSARSTRPSAPGRAGAGAPTRCGDVGPGELAGRDGVGGGPGCSATSSGCTTGRRGGRPRRLPGGNRGTPGRPTTPRRSTLVLALPGSPRRLSQGKASLGHRDVDALAGRNGVGVVVLVERADLADKTPAALITTEARTFERLAARRCDCGAPHPAGGVGHQTGDRRVVDGGGAVPGARRRSGATVRVSGCRRTARPSRGIRRPGGRPAGSACGRARLLAGDLLVAAPDPHATGESYSHSAVPVHAGDALVDHAGACRTAG